MFISLNQTWIDTMAIFFSILLFGWWFLSVWWLIAPRFFPFSNPKNANSAYPYGSFTRLQVLLYTVIAWIAILLIGSFLAPEKGSASVPVYPAGQQLVGFVIVIWLIVRSIKIGKARDVVFVTAVGDAMLSKPPSPPPTAVELTAETQALIEQEAKIRAEQDKAQSGL